MKMHDARTRRLPAPSGRPPLALVAASPAGRPPAASPRTHRAAPAAPAAPYLPAVRAAWIRTEALTDIPVRLYSWHQRLTSPPSGCSWRRRPAGPSRRPGRRGGALPPARRRRRRLEVPGGSEGAEAWRWRCPSAPRPLRPPPPRRPGPAPGPAGCVSQPSHRAGPPRAWRAAGSRWPCASSRGAGCPAPAMPAATPTPCRNG
jgi:hypothetical protein